MSIRTVTRTFVDTHRLFACRLLAIPYATATLVFVPHDISATPRDWLIGLICAVISLFGGRWPFSVLFVQSLIMLVLRALPAGVATGVVMPLVLVAFIEVVVRMNGRFIVAAAALADVVIMLTVSRTTGFAPLPLITRMLIMICGALLLGALIRSTRGRIHEAEQRVREAERRRLSETRAARAEERTAISRELHDLVAHHLSSIVLRTGVVRHVVAGADPRVVEALDDVHNDAHTALDDLRQLVGVLRDPERVDEGPGAPFADTDDLPASLDGIVERIRQTGLRVTTRIDPDITELDTVRRLAVLRLAQESLTNALRHASGATRAELTIARRPTGEIRVMVDDDGVARWKHDPDENGGHGLAGMRERVELLGGEFHAGPTASGWHVTAELPPGDAAVATVATA